MSRIADRLKALNIELPEPSAPIAVYVPFVQTGQQLYISGQVSIDAHGGIKGRLGGDLSLEGGQKAARLCALNLLAQAQAALGDLDRVARVVKLTGFVNVAPDFNHIPAVMNGCSELIVEVFGDVGRHARSAVGVANLPLHFAVEVDAVLEVR